MIQYTFRNSNQISAWGQKDQDFDATLQNILYKRSKTQQTQQSPNTIQKSHTQTKFTKLPPVKAISNKSTHRCNKKDLITKCQLYPQQHEPINIINQQQTNMTFYNKSLIKQKKAESEYQKEKRLKQKKEKREKKVTEQFFNVSKTSTISKPYSASKLVIQKDTSFSSMKRAESTQKFHLRKFYQQHQIPIKIKLKVMRHANTYLNNVKKNINIKENKQLKLDKNSKPKKNANNNNKIQQITHALIGSEFNDQYLFDFASKKTQKQQIRSKLAIQQMCRIQKNLSMPNWP